MAIISIEEAFTQLKACRSDFKVQVRDRRQQARDQLTAATATAQRIKGADAEAIAFVQAAIDNPATPKGLADKWRTDLAEHKYIRQQQAKEE